MSRTDELTDALKDLRRHTAPAGFTEAVLRRLDEAQARHAPAWPTLAGTAAVAACLALAVGLGLGVGEKERVDEVDRVDIQEPAAEPSTQSTQAAAVARLEQQRRQLQEQHRQLQAELEALSQLALEDSRAVYLGGDERVDLVWGPDPPTGYDPASYPRRR